MTTILSQNRGIPFFGDIQSVDTSNPVIASSTTVLSFESSSDRLVANLFGGQENQQIIVINNATNNNSLLSIPQARGSIGQAEFFENNNVVANNLQLARYETVQMMRVSHPVLSQIADALLGYPTPQKRACFLYLR